MKSLTVSILVLFSLIYLSNADYTNPHWVNGKSVMIHMMDWRWIDIANECENFLGPKGYGGVQVSPPNEHNVFDDQRSWMERYGPISYIIKTRSGDQAAFADMTRRCNAVGVRIYVDAVINHMTGSGTLGSAGNVVDLPNRNYPAVPFSAEHFNARCNINYWNNPYEIRNCELLGLPDLNQGNEHVRNMITNYMNNLIDMGVAGFRVDAMKHMWPHDLRVIWSRLHNLPTSHGFAANSRPFVVGEVIAGYSVQNDGFLGSDYFELGTITEFRFSQEISRVFSGQDLLKWLRTFGEGWGFWESKYALTFVDNHDNQRDGHVLTYKSGRLYKMATAFHLAWPYGVPRIMSSFNFTDRDMGPPRDVPTGNILAPVFNADGQCTNGWVCEHRWHDISGMVGWRNAAAGTAVWNWWDNDSNQIAFSRGGRAFIAFNGQFGVDLNQNLQTSLPAGTYCDVATGGKVGSSCRGKSFTVIAGGTAFISLSATDAEGFVAFHEGTRL